MRMDHGPQYTSDHFQNQIKAWGIAPSFAFLQEPETNGVAERFIRTLKEQAVYPRTFATLEELRQAVAEFVQQYNRRWRIEKKRIPRAPRSACGPRIGTSGMTMLFWKLLRETEMGAAGEHPIKGYLGQAHQTMKEWGLHHGVPSPKTPHRMMDLPCLKKRKKGLRDGPAMLCPKNRTRYTIGNFNNQGDIPLPASGWVSRKGERQRWWPIAIERMQQ